MNGMHCKHFHRGSLLMVEHMTPGKRRQMQEVLRRKIFCVEGFFFSAFEGAVSAHFL